MTAIVFYSRTLEPKTTNHRTWNHFDNSVPAVGGITTITTTGTFSFFTISAVSSSFTLYNFVPKLLIVSSLSQMEQYRQQFDNQEFKWTFVLWAISKILVKTVPYVIPCSSFTPSKSCGRENSIVLFILVYQISANLQKLVQLQSSIRTGNWQIFMLNFGWILQKILKILSHQASASRRWKTISIPHFVGSPAVFYRQ